MGERQQVSATVPADVKSAVQERADLEDRDVGKIVARAVRLYLALPVERTDVLLRRGADVAVGDHELADDEPA